MHPGAFSISLNVRDIHASQAFYATLGFVPVAGDVTQHWLILRNGDHVIGLFQGMFERNLLTFNPGWNQQGEELAEFQDIRSLQKALKAQGVDFVSEADENGTGPASFVITDPDGNPILFDQHRS